MKHADAEESGNYDVGRSEMTQGSQEIIMTYTVTQGSQENMMHRMTQEVRKQMRRRKMIYKTVTSFMAFLSNLMAGCPKKLVFNKRIN